MKKTRRIAMAVAVLLPTALLALGLAGCVPPVPDGMDADALTAAAKAAIDTATARDFEGLVAMMREDLQEETFPAEDWAAALNPILDEAGAFVEYTGSTATGQKQGEEESAIVVVQAKYQNKALIYTVAFDTDSEMTGFWVR